MRLVVAAHISVMRCITATFLARDRPRRICDHRTLDEPRWPSSAGRRLAQTIFLMHIRDMLLGYAYATPDDETLPSQRAALEAAGCSRIFEDVPRSNNNRPKFIELLDQGCDDDIVVITHLKNVVRSTSDLLNLTRKLAGMKMGLRSLTEPWVDTTLPSGGVLLTTIAGIVELERSFTDQCTCNWREAAKARGVRFGRPPKLTADQIASVKRSLEGGGSVPALAKLLNVHRATLYKILANSNT